MGEMHVLRGKSVTVAPGVAYSLSYFFDQITLELPVDYAGPSASAANAYGSVQFSTYTGEQTGEMPYAGIAGSPYYAEITGPRQSETASDGSTVNIMYFSWFGGIAGEANPYQTTLDGITITFKDTILERPAFSTGSLFYGWQGYNNIYDYSSDPPRYILATSAIRTADVFVPVIDLRSNITVVAGDFFTAGRDEVDFGALTASQLSAALAGADLYNSLAGDDLVTLPGAAAAGEIDFDRRELFSGGAGNDVIHGSDEDDLIGGGAGADTLSGGKGDDRLRGGGGSDVVRGVDTANTSTGEAGTNDIVGGAGVDTLLLPDAIGAYDIDYKFTDLFSLDPEWRFTAKSSEGEDRVAGDVEVLRDGLGRIHRVEDLQKLAIAKLTGDAFSEALEAIRDYVPGGEKIGELTPWVDYMHELLVAGLRSGSAKEPWKQLFVECNVLLVKAVQLATDQALEKAGVPSVVRDKVDDQFSDLAQLVREAAPVTYDIYMRQLEPYVDATGEWWGDFQQRWDALLKERYSAIDALNPRGAPDVPTPEVPLILRLPQTGGEDFDGSDRPAQEGGGGLLILGGGGGNRILGTQGADVLSGFRGRDRLDGGSGPDTLVGGPGRDVFVLRLGESAADTILDFEGAASATGDSVHLLGFATGTALVESAPGEYEIRDGATVVGTFTAAAGLALGVDVVFA